MRFWPALLLALAHPLLAQEVSESVAVAKDGSRTMTHEILIAAPREEVWRAVGTVEGWAEWAVPVARPIEGTARFETSYDPAAEPGSPQTIEQEWLEREMPNRVVFRTTRTPAGFPNAETYLKIVSTFELEARGPEETLLRLVSSPYPPDEAGDALLDFFQQGNAYTLDLLGQYFAERQKAPQSSLPATP